MMNSRPYKRRYAYAAISGTEPEYVDCKKAVAENAEKYTYIAADYPCANPRELAEYTRLNTDSQISSCYSQLINHKITHASKHTKLKLPNGGLMLKIPGFIDNAGRSTGYNVNKDCSITVTTIDTANGFILGMKTMSRGQFNSTYKIDDTPKPIPEPEQEEPTGTGVDFIDDLLEGITEDGKLTTKGLMIVGGGLAAVVLIALVAGKFR